MELFRTAQYYIFVEGEHSLWWDRNTAELIPKTGWDLAAADDPECLGICHGLIGKIEHQSFYDSRLMIIKECSPVGNLHGDNVVYRIKSIALLSLTVEEDLNLQPCQKHKVVDFKKQRNMGIFDLQKNAALSKTWGTIKSAGNTIKNTTQQAATIATNQVKATVRKRDVVKDKEKFERRISDEFHKIFTDTNSFYFCRTSDLTNCLQRFYKLQRDNKIDLKAIWKTVDDRFFWNKFMLRDLITKKDPLCDPWILPIIQGFVQIEQCNVEAGLDIYGSEPSEARIVTFTLSLISRRSRFRAGTRYKRRGVDEDGQVANYVETEQIISYHSHEVSFVQVRGSVPVYWSQPGYKYRPPPRLDKGEAETSLAFDKHFTGEMLNYGPICVVNLIDQFGKEKVIWDAYTEHILKFDNPNLVYVTFDFHEYCRGMHFENVQFLINSVADVIREINYCWIDKQGLICSQTGVFRVNCIDCLDRTNVVQTALAKSVLEMQFSKLGLISPDEVMPDSIRQIFQLLWANNGDIISKQYAGTNALKGDYTRTGERKFTGIMKDGMNSANRYFLGCFKDATRQFALDLMIGAPVGEVQPDGFWVSLGHVADELLPDISRAPISNMVLGPELELADALIRISRRYYLSRFKDSYRQGTVDLMLGNSISEDVFSDSRANFEEDSLATAEHVKQLIEDSKKMLISEPDLVLGAWGLIDADPVTGDTNETEMDSIVILTRDSYYVAEYDDQVDKVTKFQSVPLKDLTLLECGFPESSPSLFKTGKARQRHCIRISYRVDGSEGYYHMFRSSYLRFFNNLAVLIKSEEEEVESLKAICEAFLVARELCGLPAVPFRTSQKLDKRRSKTAKATSSSSVYLDVAGLPHLTRNVSETQLLALKSAGSKALSNMSEQFSRFKLKPRFTIGKNSAAGNKSGTSSDSDEDREDLSLYQPRPDQFLPSVGIVMGPEGGDSAAQQQPEIRIAEVKPQPPQSLALDRLDRKLSHSSGEVGGPENGPSAQQPPCTLAVDGGRLFTKRSSSEQDIAISITQSQSESALKQIREGLSNITSPVSLAAKLAKGVQTLGANLDPRKPLTMPNADERARLQDKWRGCRTRLIAL